MYEIYTVRDQGWNGITNGKLLELMIDAGFDVLLTFDKNLEHQQNFSRHPLSVFVLTAASNQYKYLQPLVPLVKQRLIQPTLGITIIGLDRF